MLTEKNEQTTFQPDGLLAVLWNNSKHGSKKTGKYDKTADDSYTNLK